MYTVIRNVLNEEQIDYLIDFYYNSGSVETRKLGAEDPPKDVVLGMCRPPTSYITYIDKYIYNIVINNLATINEPVDDYYKSNEEFSYLYYEENGFFGLHTDTPPRNVSITPANQRRMLLYPNWKTFISWVCLLKECELGGEFNIEGNKNLFREPGDLIFFNGSTPHSVDKIIQGDRLTILNFLYSQYDKGFYTA